MSSAVALAQNVEAAVDAVDPLATQYRAAMGWTHCNQFARAVARLMGAELPEVLANAQIEWLSSSAGLAAGWAPVSEQAARQWAEGGGLSVAAHYNRSGAHGHIAVLVRGQPGVTTIAQAGAKNFRAKPLASGFGYLVVDFFTYHPKRTCEAS